MAVKGLKTQFLRLSSLNAVNGGSGSGVTDTGYC